MQFAKALLAAFAVGSMVALPAHAELDVASLKQSIETSFESEYPKLDALYKDIHAHPEIAFQEEKTAAKLAARDARGRLRCYREGRQYRSLAGGQAPADCRPLQDADPLIRAIRIMGEDRAMVVGEVLKSQERANKFNALDAPLGSGGCRQGAPVI